MKYLDVLYRAFYEFRTQTLNEPSCKRLRNASVNAPSDKDKVEAVRSHCEIEEDWVDAIDRGLPFIEKAIMEERQFIRQEGSVVPIEKAKRVSKASVEHLARHGNLITHVPEDKDADLVPDKLYVEENLSNYAVYENRFLYMLLLYIRNFIEIRYNKIVELNSTYRASMRMSRVLHVGKRNLTYDLTFNDEVMNDRRGEDDLGSMPIMDRIEAQLSIVATLLATPLMREVSEAPLLKPPITRTNVLKMNNSFREALALYDYLCAYTGDGYTVEKIKKTFSPFPNDMADELSELIVLTSFMVYEYGNELRPTLRAEYDAEEERRRAEAVAQLEKRISDLKKRIAHEGIDAGEYMVLLEERLRKLHELEEENAEYVKENEYLHQLDEQNKQTVALMQSDLTAKEAELQQTKLAHEAELRGANERSEAEKSAIRAEYTQRMNERVAATEARDKETLNKTSAAYNDKIEALNSQIAALTAERDELRTERDSLDKQKTLLSAELHAVRQMHGMISASEDYTSKERFNELERELEALEQMFNEQWGHTKKRIRRDVLWKMKEQMKAEKAAAKAAKKSNTDNATDGD